MLVLENIQSQQPYDISTQKCKYCNIRTALVKTSVSLSAVNLSHFNIKFTALPVVQFRM